MSTILTETRDGVLVITLNRPEVLNSFNQSMADELLTALDIAAGDAAVRAVLITGSGRAFCAGQDLAAVLPAGASGMPDLGDVVHKQYNPIVRAIRNLEKPVVCAVNGVAAGAGANIAFACDITIAAEGASFIQSFGKIGLIPDSGGTFILPRIIGLQRAAVLTMLGEKLDANTAKEWGCSTRLCQAACLATQALIWQSVSAQCLLAHSGLTKRGFNTSFANDLEDTSRARGGFAARGRPHERLRRKVSARSRRRDLRVSKVAE